MARRKTVGGDEIDAFSKSRHVHGWRAGELKTIKNRANRRERRQVRRDVRSDLADRW